VVLLSGDDQPWLVTLTGRLAASGLPLKRRYTKGESDVPDLWLFAVQQVWA
jgi:hypothetical protein